MEMQAILTRTIVQARALTFTINARQPDRRSRTDIAIDEEGSVVGSVLTSETEDSEIAEDDLAIVIVSNLLLIINYGHSSLPYLPHHPAELNDDSCYESMNDHN